jgi:hypothetical protein
MPAATIIPFELPLPQVLPTIEGNVDYRQFRDHLLRIDRPLIGSGLETQLPEADLQRWLGRRRRVSARAQQTTNSTAGVPCAATSPGSCSKSNTEALPPDWPTAPCSSSSAG